MKALQKWLSQTPELTAKARAILDAKTKSPRITLKRLELIPRIETWRRTERSVDDNSSRGILFLQLSHELSSA